MTDIAAVDRYIEQHLDESIAELSKLVAQPDSAVAHERLALALMADVAAGDPGNRGMELSVAKTRINLGNLLALAGRTGEAMPMLREELARAKAWAREDSANAEYGAPVAECTGGLAQAWLVNARRAAPGSTAAGEAWRSAHNDFAATAATLSLWAARGDEWSADSSRSAQVARNVAVCDSALRAGSGRR